MSCDNMGKKKRIHAGWKKTMVCPPEGSLSLSSASSVSYTPGTGSVVTYHKHCNTIKFYEWINNTIIASNIQFKGWVKNSADSWWLSLFPQVVKYWRSGLWLGQSQRLYRSKTIFHQNDGRMIDNYVMWLSCYITSVTVLKE